MEFSFKGTFSKMGYLFISKYICDTKIDNCVINFRDQCVNIEKYPFKKELKEYSLNVTECFLVTLEDFRKIVQAYCLLNYDRGILYYDNGKLFADDVLFLESLLPCFNFTLKKQTL